MATISPLHEDALLFPPLDCMASPPHAHSFPPCMATLLHAHSLLHVHGHPTARSLILPPTQPSYCVLTHFPCCMATSSNK
eukprot:408437-Pelagomonas_calceolata.AAC.2